MKQKEDDEIGKQMRGDGSQRQTDEAIMQDLIADASVASVSDVVPMPTSPPLLPLLLLLLILLMLSSSS